MILLSAKGDARQTIVVRWRLHQYDGRAATQRRLRAWRRSVTITRCGNVNSAVPPHARATAHTTAALFRGIVRGGTFGDNVRTRP